jgi:hypothetical protein
MEYWNIGSVLHRIEKYHDSSDKPIIDRKNIDRGFKKLRVWLDATALYFLACKIFTSFPFKLKKVASNSINAFLTIIPLFHVGGIRPVSLKSPRFEYVIEIPRRCLHSFIS